MLEVQHSEEAPGGFDNSTLSQDPRRVSPHRDLFLSSRCAPNKLGFLTVWAVTGAGFETQVTVWLHTNVKA